MNTELQVRAARRGDEDAFMTLMAEHKAKLYRIAWSYFKNEQDALEALQETTYRAFKGIKKLKDPQYFSSWVTRVLLNYCADELKRKGRIVAENAIVCTSTEPEPDPGNFALRMAVEQLEPQSRQLIILKYFEDLTITQMAQVLNCPDGTVKTRLHRALQELRKQIGRDGEWNV